MQISTIPLTATTAFKDEIHYYRVHAVSVKRLNRVLPSNISPVTPVKLSFASRKRIR